MVSKVRMDRLVADDEKITFNIKQLLATTRAGRVAQKPPAGTVAFQTRGEKNKENGHVAVWTGPEVLSVFPHSRRATAVVALML